MSLSILRLFFIGCSFVLLALVVGIWVSYRSWVADEAAALASGSKVIETAVGPIEYRLDGESGPVFLLLHGSGGGVYSYEGVGMLERIREAGIRVLRVSRPGYLRTPIEVGRTHAEQADAFAALLDALEIDRVALLGGSAGGPSSLEFAARYPDRVWAYVALMAVSAKWPADRDAQGGLVEWAFQRSDFLGYVITRTLPESAPFLLKQVMHNPDNRQRVLDNPQMITGFAKMMRQAMTLQSYRADGSNNDSAQMKAFSLTPFDRITAPTLVVHGAADTGVPIEMGRALAASIPVGELLEIEGGDHFMVFSHSEEVLGPIVDFVKRYAPIERKDAGVANKEIGSINSGNLGATDE